MWHINSPKCDSHLAFFPEMRNVFNPLVQGEEGTKWFLFLHQGLTSVAVYAVQFRILFAECDWDDVALQRLFIHPPEAVEKTFPSGTSHLSQGFLTTLSP